MLNLGAPVELGTNIVNLRSDGEGDSIVTITAKTVPIPIGPPGFGLAIAGAVIYDLAHHTGNGATLIIGSTPETTWVSVLSSTVA